MRDPRVSVVIPTYNRADFLPQAIESALGQTFADLEVIVVDDGSDDATAAVLAAYGDRIQAIVIAHCGLPGLVRNVGVAHARGPLVAFLDSDDVWLPEKLQRQLEALERHPAAGIVCTNAYLVDATGREPRRLYLRPEQGSSGFVLGQLLEDNFVITSTALARRDLVEKAGGFAEESLLRGVEDYDLWLRIALRTEVEYLAAPLTLYRDHPAGIRHEASRRTYWQSLIRITERLREELEDVQPHDPAIRKLLRRKAGSYRIALAEAGQVESGVGKAVPAWLDAARRHPKTAASILMRRRRRRG